jgi:lysyl endopeptidase
MKILFSSMLGFYLFAPAFAGMKTTYFPSLDVQKMHSMEVAREAKDIAPRFAVAHEVAINALSEKNFSFENEVITWRHRVYAPNAVSLNFGFDKFVLSPNARLAIYSRDMKNQIRDFTVADNNVNGALWTPVIMSDDVIIELSFPAAEESQISLVLGHVGQGFRTFAQKTLKAGSCNVDVACSVSSGWEPEIGSVAVISTGGSTFCTGFMVNNTSNDRTPFFMTADHCGLKATNAASLVTYWNYQASACEGARDGALDQFNTGATFLAGSKTTDFTLLRLNKRPDPAWGVTYAGWDSSGVDATSATAIHHPNVDEKSISFENDPTSITSYLGEAVPGDSTHVRVTDWDVGTTEPGSSGSPLFDQNHRVIGQLHGGWASCQSQTSDYYGRFAMSWNGGSTPNTRLKDHLDAANTGMVTVDTLE